MFMFTHTRINLKMFCHYINSLTSTSSILPKGKVPPGCLSVDPITYVTRFSMPLEPSFGTRPLSSALSQLHTLCVAQLLLTPQIIFLRCAQINLQFFAHFVPLIIQQEPHIPPMAFTSCHDRGSNLAATPR